MPVPIYTLVRLAMWDEMLAEPAPPEECRSQRRCALRPRRRVRAQGALDKRSGVEYVKRCWHGRTVGLGRPRSSRQGRDRTDLLTRPSECTRGPHPRNRRARTRREGEGRAALHRNSRTGTSGAAESRRPVICAQTARRRATRVRSGPRVFKNNGWSCGGWAKRSPRKEKTRPRRCAQQVACIRDILRARP